MIGVTITYWILLSFDPPSFSIHATVFDTEGECYSAKADIVRSDTQEAGYTLGCLPAVYFKKG